MMNHFFTVLPFQWSAKFKPMERTANPSAASVTDTIEWYLYVASAAGGIFLFLLAGHRQSRGDSFGAALSFIGAVCFSAAPYLATKFL